jgi:catechol 2,3-dioxygenase-like lactoylglutathione lyase family enzyme
VAVQERPTAIDPALACREISGATLEVPDLDAARAFYAPIFATRDGAWEADRRTLRFRAGAQAVELVRRARPRSYPDTAYHWGYRVASSWLPALVDQLVKQGRPVSWWHEDDPAERTLSAYFADPGGNRVQLLPGDDDGPLLDHVALEEHDLEAAEFFYTRALGGRVTYSHGWDARDQVGLESWMAGDDPSAPFTRRINISYRTKRPAPMPLAHLFVTFGPTRLGLFLAQVHHQEPPPGVVRGTPQLTFTARCPADALAAHLRTVNVSPVDLKYDGGYVQFERDGDAFFLRDPGGHFVQIVCRS